MCLYTVMSTRQESKVWSGSSNVTLCWTHWQSLPPPPFPPSGLFTYREEEEREREREREKKFLIRTAAVVLDRWSLSSSSLSSSSSSSSSFFHVLTARTPVKGLVLSVLWRASRDTRRPSPFRETNVREILNGNIPQRDLFFLSLSLSLSLQRSSTQRKLLCGGQKKRRGEGGEGGNGSNMGIDGWWTPKRWKEKGEEGEIASHEAVEHTHARRLTYQQKR